MLGQPGCTRKTKFYRILNHTNLKLRLCYTMRFGNEQLNGTANIFNFNSKKTSFQTLSIDVIDNINRRMRITLTSLK